MKNNLFKDELSKLFNKDEKGAPQLNEYCVNEVKSTDLKRVVTQPKLKIPKETSFDMILKKLKKKLIEKSNSDKKTNNNSQVINQIDKLLEIFFDMETDLKLLRVGEIVDLLKSPCIQKYKIYMYDKIKHSLGDKETNQILSTIVRQCIEKSDYASYITCVDEEKFKNNADFLDYKIFLTEAKKSLYDTYSRALFIRLTLIAQDVFGLPNHKIPQNDVQIAIKHLLSLFKKDFNVSFSQKDLELTPINARRIRKYCKKPEVLQRLTDNENIINQKVEDLLICYGEFIATQINQQCNNLIKQNLGKYSSHFFSEIQQGYRHMHIYLGECNYFFMTKKPEKMDFNRVAAGIDVLFTAEEDQINMYYLNNHFEMKCQTLKSEDSQFFISLEKNANFDESKFVIQDQKMRAKCQALACNAIAVTSVDSREKYYFIVARKIVSVILAKNKLPKNTICTLINYMISFLRHHQSITLKKISKLSGRKINELIREELVNELNEKFNFDLKKDDFFSHSERLSPGKKRKKELEQKRLLSCHSADSIFEKANSRYGNFSPKQVGRQLIKELPTPPTHRNAMKKLPLLHPRTTSKSLPLSSLPRRAVTKLPSPIMLNSSQREQRRHSIRLFETTDKLTLKELMSKLAAEKSKSPPLPPSPIQNI